MTTRRDSLLHHSLHHAQVGLVVSQIKHILQIFREYERLWVGWQILLHADLEAICEKQEQTSQIQSIHQSIEHSLHAQKWLRFQSNFKQEQHLWRTNQTQKDEVPHDHKKNIATHRKKNKESTSTTKWLQSYPFAANQPINQSTNWPRQWNMDMNKTESIQEKPWR